MAFSVGGVMVSINVIFVMQYYYTEDVVFVDEDDDNSSPASEFLLVDRVKESFQGVLKLMHMIIFLLPGANDLKDA